MRKALAVFSAVGLLLAAGGPSSAQHDLKFCNFPDKDAVVGGGALAGADPGQVIFTTASDTAGPPNPYGFFVDFDDETNDKEVDGMAHMYDAYFASLTSDEAHLLVSFEGDDGSSNAIWYESKGSDPPVTRGKLWSHDDLSCCSDPNLDDVDAFKANNQVAYWVSFMGDPGDYSVYNSITGGGWLQKSKVVEAIQALGWDGDEDEVDVDAVMLNGEPPAPEVMFSIRAAAPWDGGEIVVMPLYEPGNAHFLHHGGHDWDTAFDIQAAFNVTTEEVDAIEAWIIPVEDMTSLNPAGLLMLLGLFTLCGFYVLYRRKRGLVRA